MNPNDYIPDINAYAEAWVELGLALGEEARLSDELESLKGDILQKVSTYEEFFVNGKTPSVSYADKTYLVNGHTPEAGEKLRDYAEKLANLERQITQLRGILKTEEMKQAVFQTLSANSRSVIGFNE